MKKSFKVNKEGESDKTRQGLRTYLLLESKDVCYTPIDWIPEPSLSLITYCHNCIESFMDRDLLEEFGDVTGSKDLMDRCKVGGSLLRVKVRGKNATCDTLSPQELAGPAWTCGTDAAAPTPNATTTGARARVWSSSSTTTTHGWICLRLHSVLLIINCTI